MLPVVSTSTRMFPAVRSALRTLFLSTALLGVGVQGVTAQTVDDGGDIASQQLNLPQDVTVFGKSDPNVRKATAIVNGRIITGTDIDQRLALIITANGGKVAPEEKERLRVQVLRNLIDETLQIQEAAANDIKVDPAEIEQSYERVAANFRQSPTQFDAYLRSQGSSSASIKRQIEGELAWSRLLRRNIQPFVNVSEDEVKSVVDRLNAAKGSDEFRIGEIYLSATPENRDQIIANARNIIEQIKQGGSFAAYARQFSEASTAAVGGDLGWVRPAQLPPELANAAVEMQVGQIAGPIEVAGGVSLIYVMDKRKVLTADPRDSLLSLKQLSVLFPQGTTKEQASAKAASFAAAIKEIKGCGQANEVGAKIGADVVDNDNVKLRDLPPQLQEILLNLQVGEATPPFGSITDGVRVLIVCGRDDPVSANAPNPEQIMAQLEEERVNKRARIYLRDLRRDAIIEYN
ncbi:MAG: foldase protein PrsA [Pseudomonadota bacterium]|uniref:Parvulin-like PPIase n=1 Tax=Sphingobium xenophagum TaxID=121428 RepID=A0A249MTY5_SPHXE|nr:MULTISPECIES: peptidylprolyl isomerase [Sphingobium]MBU1257428.1 peptidylprolyl isomerase [Alphaproteobacteria bacterium]ASY44654.1 peptidylprolyl isomerase [Sphingobium xenophagum]MBG6119333.1 peptidyl-prolyl cis-trans isomerase SurA [Sphingobium sp. JAI105]OUC53818.1 peptidylprolyl isomerase [Sphingobium sp. GW456-12-10-14-TSB1]PSO10903.1 peptidylprolyl isomerase [Sphingobium sp. AEW4]|tara:strand:- start:179 stop:1564 length:1386 start_codon:yes stop_codon:yes gene_type:complete